MFRDAKVGDRVWSPIGGWGTVISTSCNSKHPDYPIEIKYDVYDRGVYDRGDKSSTLRTFRHDGSVFGDGNQVLFWDEVKIIPPPKPKRKAKKHLVGTLVFNKLDPGRNPTYYKDQDIYVTDGLIKIPIRHEYEVEE